MFLQVRGRINRDTDLLVYFGLFMIQKKNTRLIAPAQTQAQKLIVLVVKQPCGTYIPISRLTVVAHWPVDSPDQPRHNPKEEAAKEQAAV